MSGYSYKLRLYLESIEVPISSAVITYNENNYTAANVSIPFAKNAQYLMPYTYAVITLTINGTEYFIFDGFLIAKGVSSNMRSNYVNYTFVDPLGLLFIWKYYSVGNSPTSLIDLVDNVYTKGKNQKPLYSHDVEILALIENITNAVNKSGNDLQKNIGDLIKKYLGKPINTLDVYSQMNTKYKILDRIKYILSSTQLDHMKLSPFVAFLRRMVHGSGSESIISRLALLLNNINHTFSAIGLPTKDDKGNIYTHHVIPKMDFVDPPACNMILNGINYNMQYNFTRIPTRAKLSVSLPFTKKDTSGKSKSNMFTRLFPKFLNKKDADYSKIWQTSSYIMKGADINTKDTGKLVSDLKDMQWPLLGTTEDIVGINPINITIPWQQIADPQKPLTTSEEGQASGDKNDVSDLYTAALTAAAEYQWYLSRTYRTPVSFNTGFNPNLIVGMPAAIIATNGDGVKGKVTSYAVSISTTSISTTTTLMNYRPKLFIDPDMTTTLGDDFKGFTKDGSANINNIYSQYGTEDINTILGSKIQLQIGHTGKNNDQAYSTPLGDIFEGKRALHKLQGPDNDYYNYPNKTVSLIYSLRLMNAALFFDKDPLSQTLNSGDYIITKHPFSILYDIATGQDAKTPPEFIDKIQERNLVTFEEFKNWIGGKSGELPRSEVHAKTVYAYKMNLDDTQEGTQI